MVELVELLVELMVETERQMSCVSVLKQIDLFEEREESKLFILFL